MIDPAVVLQGDFECEEAAHLRQGFDHCCVELVARSQVDASIVLIRWAPTSDEETSNITDRWRVPLHAYYVLSRRGDYDLTPIHSARDLNDLFPGHFDAGLVDEPRPAGCLPGVFAGLRR